MAKEKMTTQRALELLGACAPFSYAERFGDDPKKAYAKAVKEGFGHSLRDLANIPGPRTRTCRRCRGHGVETVGKDQLSYGRVMKEVARKLREEKKAEKETTR